MADTGIKYPATVSTVQETGDDNDWTTPAEVVSDNGVYGNITAASFDANDLSYLLKATNCSMGVPSGATIDGILAEIERHYAAGTVADEDVCLTKDGSARVGDDKSTAAAFPTADAITSFGGATDLWGTTWTEAEVNATTFGVLYKMKATGANADGFVDFIRITVYYTAGLTAVGDTVQEIWHIRQAIFDTNQYVYHIRSLISDTSQYIWHIRTAVGDTVQKIWNIRASVNDTVQYVWHTRATIADALQYVWNIRGTIGKSVQKIWHIRGAIGDTSQYVWNVLSSVTAVGDSFQVVWHIRGAVAQTRQALWNVRQAIGNTSQLIYHIRTSVFDTIQHIWNVRVAIGQGRQALWNIRKAIAQTRQALWNVTGVINQTRQALWHIRKTIGRTGETVWNIQFGRRFTIDTSVSISQAFTMIKSTTKMFDLTASLSKNLKLKGIIQGA